MTDTHVTVLDGDDIVQISETTSVVGVTEAIDTLNCSEITDVIQPQFAEIIVGQKGDKGDAGAISVSLIAGEAINATKPIRLNATGLAMIADSNDTTQAGTVIGISATAAAVSWVVDVNQGGKLVSNTWTWIAGPIYLGIRELTQIPPTTGILQILGVALSATEIIINVQQPIVR